MALSVNTSKAGSTMPQVESRPAADVLGLPGGGFAEQLLGQLQAPPAEAPAEAAAAPAAPEAAAQAPAAEAKPVQPEGDDKAQAQRPVQRSRAVGAKGAREDDVRADDPSGRAADVKLSAEAVGDVQAGTGRAVPRDAREEPAVAAAPAVLDLMMQFVNRPQAAGGAGRGRAAGQVAVEAGAKQRPAGDAAAAALADRPDVASARGLAGRDAGDAFAEAMKSASGRSTPTGEPVRAQLEQSPVADAAGTPVPGVAPQPQPIAAPASAQVTLGSDVRSPAFRDELAAQVSTFARDGVQEAVLNLNPAEMGPITVQIAMDGTQARIDFQAALPATRELIEGTLPSLASALHGEGLTLSGGSVGDQRAPSQGREGDASGRSFDRRTTDSRGTEPVATGSAAPAHRGDAVLDMYA